jgi:hypothetical protein
MAPIILPLLAGCGDDRIVMVDAAGVRATCGTGTYWIMPGFEQVERREACRRRLTATGFREER